MEEDEIDESLLLELFEVIEKYDFHFFNPRDSFWRCMAAEKITDIGCNFQTETHIYQYDGKTKGEAFKNTMQRLLKEQP